MANLTCNIQAGNALSDPLDCTQVTQLDFIAMPGAWTPALLTFQFSPDNGVTYFDVFDEKSAEVAVNVIPGAFVRLPDAFPIIGKSFVKFRSGSRDNPVAQQAQRSFVVGAT